MSRNSTASRPVLMPQPSAAPPPTASLGPTDLDGAMASLDAFHRANGLPPIAARGSRVHVPVDLATAAPALTIKAQMQAGADAARRLLHPEAMTIEQRATLALAKRSERVQQEDSRAAKAKADHQAGAETARRLLGK